MDREYSLPTTCINMTINLAVPYYSQRNNEFRPSGTCNITSVAMCLAFYGIKAKEKPQLEDELFLKVQNNGWERHTHDDLAKLFRLYGIEDRFTTEAPWNNVKSHLDGGNPVIISGQFTQSGHIIVLRGYDEKGFFVNDPWGEWFADGYKNQSGENLHYSYNLCNRVSYGGSKTTWAHFPQQKKPVELPACGVELIKSFEECCLEAYPDPLTKDKPITIGWGSTRKRDGSAWKLGETITQPEADSLLIYQLKTDYLPKLANIPRWSKFNINQQGALLSFAYNLGANFYGNSGFDSITAMLQSQSWSSSSVRDTFIKYRNPGTSVEEQLRERRLAEAELFLKQL